MKKLKYILSIIQRRIATVFLLSIMFSSLLLIFMVGLSIKDIFYDYLRSDYGNIPDMKIKVQDLDSATMQKIKKDIKQIDSSIDVLYGYEDIYELTITDSEDSLLANKMPVLVKGMNLERKLQVEIDSKRYELDIAKFEYVEEFLLKLKLGDIKVKDKNSIKLISKDKTIAFNFCKEIAIEENLLKIKSVFCKDKVDDLFKIIEEKSLKTITITADGKKTTQKILEVDELYRTVVLSYSDTKEPQELSISLDDIEIDLSYMETPEAFDGQLIVTFKRIQNMELNYKRYISSILQDFINYNRFVLKVKNYSFEEDNEDEENQEDSATLSEELMRLNELTDILDIINFTNGNSAIASEFLASDLNNFGLLDNFTIATKSGEFNANIRSTFYYNPERLYDSNILIFNNKVIQEQFGIGDKNNYIDIYVQSSNDAQLIAIQNILNRYDKDAKFILQSDIIPSITPKKQVFNMVVIVFSSFIFGILFVAMYVVLIQFYSNFESELALLKLFGSNQPYQAYINFMSFLVASLLIFFMLQKEEQLINAIMQKYFFTSYSFDMNNYILSLSVLSVYIIVMYIMELANIKKLNLIKGQ